MSSTWGNAIKISIFGESHSDSIGINIDSPPPGEKLNLDEIVFNMKKRAPKRTCYSTSRNEADVVKIVSGFLNGFTTGTPLCAIIKNTNAKPSDYDNILSAVRPGHADYTGFVRYNGFNDTRGSGHFSGRLTAPITFAGAVCKQILKNRNINICAHIYSIGSVNDTPFDMANIPKNMANRLNTELFPTIDSNIKKQMESEISAAKNSNDSIGGIIECAILGVPAGIGSPIFDGIENKIASIIFGIPGIKGIEFGCGFSSSKMYGSQNNDSFVIDSGKIKTLTNNHGGILGGISSGMPIVFRVCVKPTPSIFKNQNTVNILTKQQTSLNVSGRHDACIVPRAVPVVESCAAIAILDLLMENHKPL